MRDERFPVSFSVYLTWQDRAGLSRRVSARCLDLSPEGIRIEARDRLDTGTTLLVSSNEFGRMGLATVRYCRRDGMRFLVGLRFGATFGLGDPARRKILARIIKPDPPPAPACGESNAAA